MSRNTEKQCILPSNKDKTFSTKDEFAQYTNQQSEKKLQKITADKNTVSLRLHMADDILY